MVTHWTHWYWILLILVLGSSWIKKWHNNMGVFLAQEKAQTLLKREIQGVAHFVAAYGTLQCLFWDITHGSFLCECFGKVKVLHWS
jgi:hypothetical protein